MNGLREVVLDVSDPEGRVAAKLRIALLPDRYLQAGQAVLLDLRGVPERDEVLEPIQLLEGVEYRYVIEDNLAALTIATDRRDIFAPDDATGRTGRVRPGLSTGAVHAQLRGDGEPIGTIAFEVRSRKLNYLTDYRRMVADVAEAAAEAVMERFAASEQAFAPTEGGDPQTLYQRFAFLQSVFSNDTFQAALHQVIARPYESWESIDEERRPGRGLRGHAGLARELSRPGPRVAWPGGALGGWLPAIVRESRTESTLDNAPNQFVKYALNRWREVIQQLCDAMQRLRPGVPVERGIQESQIVLNQLDAILGEELFREVGDLTVFPSGNQVLQKREGYRDILRAFVQFEVASQVSWAGGEDVFRAGQRNVATLYEYWTYIQLARMLSELCQMGFDFGSLLELSADGVGLGLRKGRGTVLRGNATRLGRQVEVEMWYNRRFDRPAGESEISWAAGRSQDGSWTVGMQPDISIRISPDPGALEYCDPVWVHFDAKYRVERIEEVLGVTAPEVGDPPSPSTASEPPAGRAESKNDDLLKMHAYRDGIRLSAGAYVLYPGDLNQKRRTYRETLPGLGAFRLRPQAAGVADGTSELRVFLNDILTHVARQASQHERMRFWTSRVYEGKRPTPWAPSAMFLQEPPADTRVLVGFVKSDEHREWIHGEHLYNLRADERRGSIVLSLLQCDLLLMWGRGLGADVELWRVDQEVETVTGVDLRGLGYPEPKGSKYYCLRLTERIPNVRFAGLSRSSLESVLAVAAPVALAGAPVILSWASLGPKVWEGHGG